MTHRQNDLNYEIKYDVVGNYFLQPKFRADRLEIVMKISVRLTWTGTFWKPSVIGLYTAAHVYAFTEYVYIYIYAMLNNIYLNTISFRVFFLGNFFYCYVCLIWMLSFISALTHNSESMKTCEEQYSVQFVVQFMFI